ncbi:Phosphoglycerol transferase MdoB [Natronincola peptidivorans]|uniref:Phosphoglycerol transferase MdoB n=1 Tax=Natronincola peptidivorans TaxID=426128 RepID=A0A1I0F9P0_9FIRM|nr:LTA synthase family protein [Natronincola peptidivorans]SET54632.1 Phosphoglycerol transferase MdoB [Natronincola peptidivorans]
MLTGGASRTNNYKDIGLFTIGTLFKLFILHYYIGLSDGLITITLRNFLIIIGIYSLASLVKEHRRLTVFLTINIVLSALFFIDVMYYSHFFTLVPAQSIYQVGQLGPVSESIFFLIRPYYFLLFTDTLLLWRYSRKNNKGRSREIFVASRKQKLVYLTVFGLVLLFTVGITYRTVRNTNGNYTPYNLGAIHFHLFDLVNLFVRSPLDIDKVEGIVETINQDTGERNGFAVAQNRNVIVIQAESIQSFVINKEIEGQMITPVLNQLIHNDSIYFSQFYEQAGWGNTSDAEFVSHNGFYPSIRTFSYKAYEDNEFVTLPMQLKEKGYSTIVFHGNEASFWNRENIYPSQGLDTYISQEDLQEDEIIGMGISDGSLFRQSMDFLKEQPHPFYAFYITLTSHHPFIMEEQYKDLNIEGEYKDTLLENYLQTVHYLDKEIGNFIEKLKQEGLYDESIIIIYGDHQGLDMRNEEANQLLSSFLEKPYREDEMFRVPLIVHIPNSDFHEEITTTGGQIDFFPTIGNLLGIRPQPNKTLGKDLLNIEEGFVAKQVHVARGSFIDNDKIFIMANDGVFENSTAWSIKTGEPIDVEECREGYERALAEVHLSEYILQNNLIPLVREKGLEYVIQHQPQ